MLQVLDQAKNAREKTIWFWGHISHGARGMMPFFNPSRLILPCLTGIFLGFACLVSPMLGAVLGLGFFILLLSLSNPIILCYLVISAIILTSGIERGRLFPILSGNEVCLLGAFGISILITLVDTRKKITITKYYWLAMIFLIGGTVIMPIAIYLLMGTRLTMSNAFKMVGPLQYFLLFWLFAIIPNGESDRRRIFYWMLVFGFLVAIVGLLQGLNISIVDQILDRLYSSSHEAMAARAGRITSLLGSWNSLGIFMMSVMLIGWAILFEVRLTRERWLIVGIMAFSVLCLIASGSFAGLIGLAIGIFVLQVLNQRKIRSLTFLMVGLFGAILSIILFYPFLQPLLDKRLTYQFGYGGLVPQTLLYRFKVWREIFIPAIQQHFPLPVSPTVPSYYAWQFEESQYILLLFRTGLLGFLGYLTWIGITIAWLYQRYRHSQGFDKAIASVALTLIFVLLIAGFTNEVFSFAGTIDYLWIMLALVANSKEKI